MTENNSLESARESIEAHQEATGHEDIDYILVNHSPRVVSISCHECGQHLAVASQ